ncbi:MAG: gliding motility-associated protein GldL [Flammeovirgaceae bacterium]|jgi:gliding motility-associated protein GldL
MMKTESKLNWFYRVVIPKATSVGAAVVVVGALFKIEHLPGAGVMLAVGLLTEAAIFLFGLFQPSPPPEAHYEWEKVYPGLADDTIKPVIQQGGKKLPVRDDKTAIALAAMESQLASAVKPEMLKNFGAGMESLTKTVGQIKDVTNTTVASEAYTKSLTTATKSMGDLNSAYSKTLGAMSEMANATKDAKEYHSQVQVITKNLGALNAVYEMELKDANSHLKAMNKFYTNLTTAMESMSDASKESQVFKDQMKSLTTNLTQLNKVYGNMLSAMKG